MRPSRRVLIFVLIFFLAIFLRLYRFSELTSFWLDQAIDLLVARRALVDGVWPLVGPYLSVGKFSVPPTYFYLLTFFLWLGKTPEGTALFFVFLDITAMIFLYLLARRLLDEWAGIIVTFFYAISVTMISHARSMWQPYPVQVFLAGSLYFLFLGWERRKTAFLVLSVALYAIATSIYPSPILLLPFFLSHIFRFFHTIKRFSTLSSFIRSVMLIGVCFVLVSLPLIVFEMNHDFPTYNALQTSSFGFPSVADIVSDFPMNVFGLFLAFGSLGVLHPSNYVLYVLLFGVLFLFATVVFIIQSRAGFKQYRTAISFFSIPWLIVGFTGILFFRDMFNLGWPWHRLYGFFPFLFIMFGLIVRFAFSYRKTWYVVPVVFLVGLYIVGSGLSLMGRLAYSYDVSQAQMARELARYINNSLVNHNGEDRDIAVLAYVPSGDWASPVTPEKYFLWEMYGNRVVFDEFGNNLQYYLNKPPRPNVVLVCKEFRNIEDIYDTCLRAFFERFPNYLVTAQKLFPLNTVVFTLKKRTV